jgi:heavy metal sensor kinase
MQTSILVGRSVRREMEQLRAFAWGIGGAGIIVLLVGLAGGWLVSGRILKPIQAISETASAISETNLSERIDTEAVDRELAELAEVLNETFTRLEAAFARQVRFTADASHELRTPLAIIRSQAELALARPRTVEHYRQAIESCLRACQRMTELVEELLMLARADAGKLDLESRPIDLKRVVNDVLVLMRPLADSKKVRIETDLKTAPLVGDAGRLGQVVTNLVSNAIQYNRPGGSVRIHLSTENGSTQLAVEDTGCGIPQEDRPHLFERFYRTDKARSRASGGHGLGLAISKSIVEAHGGTLEFQSEPGHGSKFTVRLPGHG